MKRFVGLMLSFAFVVALVGGMTGCPDNTKKTTPAAKDAPAKDAPAKDAPAKDGEPKKDAK